MKKAFTMLEFVFVIVVMGILAATIIPSTKTNPVQEAAIQVLSHIRYTQHLAMVDDKYDAGDAEWYKGRWQLIFYNGDNSNDVPAYTIFSDKSTYSGNPSKEEIAKDPRTKSRLMSGGYSGSSTLDIRDDTNFDGIKSMNIGMKYGITGYQLSGGCSGARISFDYLGRPINGDLSTMSSSYNSGSTQRLMTADCNVTLTSDSESLTITVEPETGYAKINF